MGWLIAAVLTFAAANNAQEICLSGENDPYLLFGTKTAYIFANRGLPNNARVHEVPGCKPIAFWMLNRHGSHNPEADEIEKLKNLTDLKYNIISNYNNGNFRNTNQSICASDYDLLGRWSWKPNHNLTFAGDLTSDGYISAQQLAQTWKQKYPGLFTDNRHNYLFKFANDKRSATTFRAFTEGLFRSMVDNYDLPKENNETSVKPYASCNAWKSEVEDNQDTLSHRLIFESKRKFKEMITNVSLRLGFNYDIEPQFVHTIYKMCRYNKAWDVTQISPWCAAFSKEDLKLLEYAEDLETYYKYGYGKELNKKVGCAYVKDMMNFLKKHVDSEGSHQPKVLIQFSEAPAILMTLGAMHAHEDSVPLTGDNYQTPAIQARKWTTSTMAPYNANLAAVLYECTLNGNFQVNDQYQVLILENEKPISFDWCRVGLCEWSQLVSKLGEIANNCDLEVCNGAPTIGTHMALAIVAAIFVRVAIL